ncbi:hypothetical protein [Fluviicola taffensis]|uniref:Lipoprotein n=1 Tax=Fluviicola taffensis (strain DSM 16823 / NCIMB 13979 / RW262) TaxID=755732 RepID=F2IJ20_FLUTR|nr:hypothetical protein [Fluviicola taffensis]AEA43878.1 hypothetical protein Fluta_1891 [Fluviicola taffensis DSM 16823]
MKKIFFGIAIIAAISSCKKVEGDGGRASITGNVLVSETLYINGQEVDTVTYSGAKEDIYIVYGEGNTMYNDKIEASYDGSFKFEFLQPGTYTIFGYSEILHKGNNIPNNDDDYKTLEVVSKTITISKKEQGDLGTITLLKNW